MEITYAIRRSLRDLPTDLYVESSKDGALPMDNEVAYEFKPMKNPLFEDSYGRLFGPNVNLNARSDLFFASFYDRFLKTPGVAELFARTDMTRQVQMLKRSLFQLVSFYVSGEPSAELVRLSEVHGHLGISHEMYDAWLEALTETVLEHDREADEATRLAWCWALAPGITYMRMGLHDKI